MFQQNVIHSSENAAYFARHIGLHGGVPQKIPALTLNRLCGSGMQAIVTGAQHILLGEAQIVLAGGVENMSQAPYANFKQRFGSASIVIAGEDAEQNHGLKPLARIVSWGVVGVDPTIMGISPVPAFKQALERANLTIDDIDVFEVNKAFTAQFLAVEKELGLNRSKTNIHGGAITLGHPVGARGARVLLSAAYELKRWKGKYAVTSLCIGGGQGIAVLIEYLESEQTRMNIGVVTSGIMGNGIAQTFAMAGFDVILSDLKLI